MKKLLILSLIAVLLCGCSSKPVSASCTLTEGGIKSSIVFEAQKEKDVVDDFTLITFISYEELGIDKDDEEMKEVFTSVYKETPSEFGEAEIVWDDNGLSVSYKMSTKTMSPEGLTFQEMLQSLKDEGFECK